MKPLQSNFLGVQELEWPLEAALELGLGSEEALGSLLGMDVTAEGNQRGAASKPCVGHGN